MDFNINFVKLIFSFLTISILVSTYLICSKENFIPLVFTRSFRYGKYAEKAENFLMQLFELPKNYFRHFYLFSTPLSTFFLLLTIYKYIFNRELSGIIFLLLNVFLGSSRTALVSSEATTIAMILMTIQCWKRLFETHRVSVFSNAKINIIHYIAGYVHYIGSVVSIVGESTGFVRGFNVNLKWSRVNSLHVVCAIIFIIASYEQLRTNFILANLRKNKDGQVVTTSYQIPTGRLFEYVSSPLQFTEIIMYTMLSCILWQSSSFHYVTAWVIVNQISTALMSHQWYRKTFKDYPEHRKILIPFLI